MDNKKTGMQVAVVVAIGAVAGALYYYMNSLSTVNVLVPTRDIKAGEALSGENTTMATVGNTGLHKNAITEKRVGEAGNKVASAPLFTGEVILFDRVADSLNDTITKNMDDAKHNFAVKIPVDENNSPIGAKIGSKLAIFSTIDTESSSTTGLVDYYKLIQIAENAEGSVSSVVVEATPNNASKLYAAIQAGKVSMALISETRDAGVLTSGVTNDQIPGILLQGK